MKKLIGYIEENLNRDKLAELTSTVIDAYRKEDDFTLRHFVSFLPEEQRSSGRKRQFYSLVKKLHPDRFPVLQQEYRDAAARSDRDALERMMEMLKLVSSGRQQKAERFEYSHRETHVPEYDYFSGESGEDEDEYFDGEVEEGSFISAVRNIIFGGHGFSIDAADLGQIDGSLDLNGCGIDDLEGVEFCRNVRTLDISDNDISNIFDLQFISGLEELYASSNSIRDLEPLEDLGRLEILELSSNDIEDLGPLLRMSSLKFADIRRNPVKDTGQIEALKTAGVIVLF